MRLPGFHAQESLLEATRSYRPPTGGAAAGAQGRVVAMFTPSNRDPNCESMCFKLHAMRIMTIEEAMGDPKRYEKTMGAIAELNRCLKACHRTNPADYA